jgi:hypothetical protein
MRVRRTLTIVGVAALAVVLLFGFVVKFSAAESRFECAGSFANDKTKRTVPAFIKLHEYRWWVGLWSDSQGALWLEIPNETVEYFGDVTRTGDQLQIREKGKLVGGFSTLSKTLALNLSRGFYDGNCKRITE